MSFDGEYKVEHGDDRKGFYDIAEAWTCSNNIGSKWYFYPFHFVVSFSTKTIVAAPCGMESLAGRRTASVARIFNKFAVEPAAQSLTVYKFFQYVTGRLI
jgi:hypothetical protein